MAECKFGYIAVGVIFRGNRWLDGIVYNQTAMKRKDLRSSISNTIRHSKQYSQLHAVIVAKQELFSSLELAELASNIHIPVIALLGSKNHPKIQLKARSEVKKYELKVRDQNVAVLAAGIGKEQAEEILAIGSGFAASAPEAVRVAKLVVNCRLQ